MSYAVPQVDWSPLGNLLNTYQTARNQATLRNLGSLVSEDGSPDYGRMAQAMFQTGNADAGLRLSQLAEGRRAYRDALPMITGGLSGSPAQASPGQPPPAAPASSAPSQPTQTQAQFIEQMMPHAQRVAAATGLDPRLIIAQAAQETGWGRSAPGHNYFGIKSHGQAGGNTLPTIEVVNGQPVRQNASFRAYGDMGQSADDYGRFLQQNPRYRGLLTAQGLDAQLAALGASGYATDPNYASSVGRIARGIPFPGQNGAPVQMASTAGGSMTDAGAPQTPRQAPQQAAPDVSRLLAAIANPALPDSARQALTLQLQRLQPSLDIKTTQDGAIVAINTRTGQSTIIREPARPPMAVGSDQRLIDPNTGREIVGSSQTRTITDPAERARLGISPADTRVYQMKPNGEVTAVGGAPADSGRIPPGYRPTRDAQGNITGLEAIPGGPAAREAADKEEADAKRKQATQQRAGLITQEIDRAQQIMNSGILPSAGAGARLAGIPATNARDLAAALDTIKANIGFAELNSMRQQSPTGGALGNVTERELAYLQAVAGSLDQGQSPAALKANLDRLWNAYQDVIHGPNAGPQRRANAAGQPQPAARPGAPQAGAVENGWRFKGGDPSKRENWERTQ
ncbi:MAG TPA: glucosaminidase domain-containing protein [Burkholderiaceae bacterium]